MPGSGVKSFANKLVLITGASSGIGWQAALDFASEGARLLLVARREDRLKSLVEKIHLKSGEAEVLPCDLSDPWSRDRLVTNIVSRFTSPDILINCAGYGNYRSFLQESPPEIARMMQVNYIAAAHLIATFLPEMVKRGSGSMVNISSGAGKVATPFMAPYCASKFALCALTESLSYELKGTGVTIHLVNPGPVDTEFFDAGVWKGRQSQKKASARQVSKAIRTAILKDRLMTYVPASRRLLVYGFNLLGPAGRWVLQRRADRHKATASESC